MNGDVAGLVYVAAHMPDAEESEADDGKRFPSDLTAIKKTPDGSSYEELLERATPKVQFKKLMSAYCARPRNPRIARLSFIKSASQ